MRSILTVTALFLAAMGCSDEPDDLNDTTSAGGAATGGANAGSANTGGQNTGGQNAGGQNAGGQNAGGADGGAGGVGGQGDAICDSGWTFPTEQTRLDCLGAQCCDEAKDCRNDPYCSSCLVDDDVGLCDITKADEALKGCAYIACGADCML